jgi:pimeloyl-ACP methyl ester carboxylesterase
MPTGRGRSSWPCTESKVPANDVECGYRFVRSIAAEYGGDLDQPVTFVGWSLGATAALGVGLTEDIDPTGTFVSCFDNAPRPDVIVAISGCYFEFEGIRQNYFDVSGWGNKDAEVILLAGDRDNTCAVWQSQDAAEQLRSGGYGVDLVLLEGANHYAPIFRDLVDGDWVVIADDPAGERAVRVILNAAAVEHVQPSPTPR